MFGILRTQQRTVARSLQLARQLATQTPPPPPNSSKNGGKNKGKNSGKGKGAADAGAGAASASSASEAPAPNELEATPTPEPTPAPPPPPPAPTTLSLDFSADSRPRTASIGAGAGGVGDNSERTGATSAHGAQSSLERQRQSAARRALIVLGLGVIAGAVYIGRDWEEEELQARKMAREAAPSGWWARVRARAGDTAGVFTQPAFKELLPPPQPPPMGKPYTLVLSLDDLLVTSTWDRQNGWRTAKRPGVDYFIAYLSQFYELVIFTSKPGFLANQIVEALDPYTYFILHRLGREHTRSLATGIVKDLDYLNRDLSKVVVLDTDTTHVAAHPENAIIIPKWTGDPTDKGLIAMIPFLESIGIYKPQDVRKTIEAYKGKDIPVEYAKVEAEGKRLYLEDLKKRGKRTSGGGLSLNSFLGGASTRDNAGPLTYLEEKRREAQEFYKAEQRYIAESKAEWDRQKKQWEADAAAATPGTMMQFVGAMMGGAPPGAAPGGVPGGAVQPGASGTTAAPGGVGASGAVKS